MPMDIYKSHGHIINTNHFYSFETNCHLIIITATSGAAAKCVCGQLLYSSVAVLSLLTTLV